VEEEAMTTTKRTPSSKEIAIIAVNKGIPKQHARCSLVMPTKDQRGLSQEMMGMKQELQQKKLVTRLNTFMIAMEFPKDQTFLDNPNIWIGDTCVSVHMTPHRNGMINVKKAEGNDAITMGNGKSEDAAVIGSIDGKLCDKNGNQIRHQDPNTERSPLCNVS
jgi:hypothetical protein